MRNLRRLAAICIFSIFSTALLAATNPFLGTWKLNSAKSKFAPGTAYSDMTVTFEAVGDQIKRVATGTDADGKPINENSTIAWDGKDHDIGEPGITVAVTQVNDHTLNVKVKHEGKVMSSIRVVASKNGKTVTAAEKGEDLKGRKLDNVEVWDKH
jgi:hypothetical protein